MKKFVNKAANQLSQFTVRDAIQNQRRDSSSIESTLRNQLGLTRQNGNEQVTQNPGMVMLETTARWKDSFEAKTDIAGHDNLKAKIETMQAQWQALLGLLEQIRVKAWAIHERDKDNNSNVNEAKAECNQWLQELIILRDTKVGPLFEQFTANLAAIRNAIVKRQQIEDLETTIKTNRLEWNALLQNDYITIKPNIVAAKLATLDAGLTNLKANVDTDDFQTAIVALTQTVQENFATRLVLEKRAADNKIKAEAAAITAAHEAAADEFEVYPAAPPVMLSNAGQAAATGSVNTTATTDNANDETASVVTATSEDDFEQVAPGTSFSLTQ